MRKAQQIKREIGATAGLSRRLSGDHSDSAGAHHVFSSAGNGSGSSGHEAGVLTSRWSMEGSMGHRVMRNSTFNHGHRSPVQGAGDCAAAAVAAGAAVAESEARLAAKLETSALMMGAVKSEIQDVRSDQEACMMSLSKLAAGMHELLVRGATGAWTGAV